MELVTPEEVVKIKQHEHNEKVEQTKRKRAMKHRIEEHQEYLREKDDGYDE